MNNYLFPIYFTDHLNLFQLGGFLGVKCCSPSTWNSCLSCNQIKVQVNPLPKYFKCHSHIIIVRYGIIYLLILEIELFKDKLINLFSSQDIYHTCWKKNCISPCINTLFELFDCELFILRNPSFNYFYGRGCPYFNCGHGCLGSKLNHRQELIQCTLRNAI